MQTLKTRSVFLLSVLSVLFCVCLAAPPIPGVRATIRYEHQAPLHKDAYSVTYNSLGALQSLQWRQYYQWYSTTGSWTPIYTTPPSYFPGQESWSAGGTPLFDTEANYLHGDLMNYFKCTAQPGSPIGGQAIISGTYHDQTDYPLTFTYESLDRDGFSMGSSHDYDEYNNGWYTVTVNDGFHEWLTYTLDNTETYDHRLEYEKGHYTTIPEYVPQYLTKWNINGEPYLVLKRQSLPYASDVATSPITGIDLSGLAGCQFTTTYNVYGAPHGRVLRYESFGTHLPDGAEARITLTYDAPEEGRVNALEVYSQGQTKQKVDIVYGANDTLDSVVHSSEVDDFCYTVTLQHEFLDPYYYVEGMQIQSSPDVSSHITPTYDDALTGTVNSTSRFNMFFFRQGERYPFVGADNVGDHYIFLRDPATQLPWGRLTLTPHNDLFTMYCYCADGKLGALWTIRMWSYCCGLQTKDLKVFQYDGQGRLHTAMNVEPGWHAGHTYFFFHNEYGYPDIVADAHGSGVEFRYLAPKEPGTPYLPIISRVNAAWGLEAGDVLPFPAGSELVTPTPTATPTPAATHTPVREWDFEGTSHNWQFQTPSPGYAHLEHWQHATAIDTDPNAIGIASPYDESTNYFALWDSLTAELIPYQANSIYRADWYFSTNRDSANTVPSLRFRMGLDNQKAFAYSRVYSGDWLPLAKRPSSTLYQTFFEPPIASSNLFLAFSLIDWASDFRGTSPAGDVYLEEVSVFRHDLAEFDPWQSQASLSGSDFDSWTTAGAPGYQAPGFTRESDHSLTLSSGINSSMVFGAWDSGANLFNLQPGQLYRLKANLSSPDQLGGPNLRLRSHTDDFRQSWYTYYVGSYTAGESALPPAGGADYHLYLNLLDSASQTGRFAFDLIDFSETEGGSHTLHQLDLHSHSPP